MPLSVAIEMGDLPAWLALAVPAVVGFLFVVPPLWVSADIDPTWQIQARVRCLRPWKRTITLLEPLDGLPSRFDRWFGRGRVRAIVLPTRSTEMHSGAAVDGFGNVENFVIDLRQPKPDSRVGMVVKCGRRSHYAWATTVTHPFDYGNEPDEEPHDLAGGDHDGAVH